MNHRAETAKVALSPDGQLMLPPEVRQRWNLEDGGSVEVIDLGTSLVVLPTQTVRGALSQTIDEVGGYVRLAAQVAATEPDLSSSL